MAAFYFFTDVDYLPAQTISQSFGPLDSSPYRDYRTCSLFNGIQTGTQLKAYAITTGEFFIQEVSAAPNIVNLILKPDDQPNNKIGLVKYFVYRGLKKDSFLQSDGSVVPDVSNLSKVMSRMWEVRNKLNTEAGVSEILTRNDLGLNEIGTSTPVPGSTLIEDFFETYVFQRLEAGWHIGDFETGGDYGLQVIVEGPNYRPVLDEMRLLDHKVTITYQAGQPKFEDQVEEDIKTKLDREKILSFVDPAAYFGLLAFEKIKLYKSDTLTTIANDPQLFFSDILSKFFTKDKIYLDIRNDLNNSLNFYGSYSDSSMPTKIAVVKFRDASNALTNKEYHTSGWPIMTIMASEFVSNSADFTKAELQLPQGDNIYPALFFSGASFYSDALNYKEKFKVLNVNNNYSDSFEVSVPAIASTGTPLPALLKFSYTRRYDIDNLLPIPATLSRPWKDDYIDNLLTLNEVNITPPANDPNFSNTVKWNTHSELKYIGWTSLKGFDFTVRTGKAMESIGETFYAYIAGASFSKGKASRTDNHSNLMLENGKSQFYSIFHVLKENGIIDFGQYEIPISGTNIECIKVDSKYDNLSVDILNKSGDDILSISIDSASLNQILNAATSSFLLNLSQYFVALNHNLNASDKNYPYFVFDVGLNGMDPNGNHVVGINTGVKVYSINGKNYFTEQYSLELKNKIQ